MGAWEEWKKSVCALILVLAALGAVQVWSRAAPRREDGGPWLPAPRLESSGVRVPAAGEAPLPPQVSKAFPDSDQEYFVLAPPSSYTGLNRARYANARNYENRAGTKQTDGYGFGNDIVPGLVPSPFRTVSGSCTSPFNY